MLDVGRLRTRLLCWLQRIRYSLVSVRVHVSISILINTIDALSKLPPIQLKSEEEILDDKTPRAISFDHTQADDEDDVASPLDTSTSPGLLHDSPTVVLSPNSTREQDDPVPKIVAETESTSQVTSPSTTAPSAPTPVSGDIVLPLMIFAAVKANPPHLVSHLLYTQRFRNQAVGGEESYCLINLMAVAEFLENVDLAALGLGDSEKHVIR